MAEEEGELMSDLVYGLAEIPNHKLTATVDISMDELDERYFDLEDAIADFDEPEEGEH